MTYVVGIDQGSTYTKAVILDSQQQVLGKAMQRTGFRLPEAAEATLAEALSQAGLERREVTYTVSTGYGRHQVPFRDAQVTDLTAHARGASFYYPETRTVLDVGGQTMKVSRLDEMGKVVSFRLNDKCAAGTGTFLEKTARYMGFSVEEIGPLAATSKEPATISGVCAVFAESEVINQLSNGSAPADIMYGAIYSLVERTLQLLKRVRGEPSYTLVGGITRFDSFARIVRETLGDQVAVPPAEMAQYCGALGAARLGLRRLEKMHSGVS